MARNKYLVAKGKALSMIREFEKIYPARDVRPIIIREVMFAIENEFGEEPVDYEKVVDLIKTIAASEASPL
jgi:hypothetical protein